MAVALMQAIRTSVAMIDGVRKDHDETKRLDSFRVGGDAGRSMMEACYAW